MSPEWVASYRIPRDVSRGTSGVVAELAYEFSGEFTPWHQNEAVWLVSSRADHIFRSAQVHIAEEHGEWFFAIVPFVLKSVDERYTAVLGVKERQNNLVKVQLDDPEVWEKLEAGVRRTFEFARDFPTENLVPNE